MRKMWRCSVLPIDKTRTRNRSKTQQYDRNGEMPIKAQGEVRWKKEHDNVNHPSHYETGKFECIDVMIETQGIEATKNFCVCNALKYIYRHNMKNGEEDLRKAKQYLDKYMELIDNSNSAETPHN